MSTNQMTETDALAECLAPVLADATSFGAEQAMAAVTIANRLMRAEKISDETHARIMGRLGNHSALRQWAIKMRLLPASDAKPDALCVAIQAIFAKKDAYLAAMAEEKPKA